MTNIYDPEPPSVYPIQSWLDDYSWFCQQPEQVVSDLLSGDISAFYRHFSDTRKDSDVADFCRRRFVAAMSFLQENLDMIDFGKFGVVGTDKALVSKPVIITLYRFFAARPDHAVDMPLPRDVFIQELKNVYDPSA
jgi:hypothetical protein